MNELVYQLGQIIDNVQLHLQFTLSVIALLFAIYFVNTFLLGRMLFAFGLLPRSIPGLIGIFASPFLHGSFNHVFFNSIPLFALMNLVLLDGEWVFAIVTASIVTLSGLLVWLFGRKSIHVGASSLILGYWSYCVFEIPQKGLVQAMILGIVCLYQFGTLLMDLVPSDRATSWEGHLYGFLAGIVTVYLMPMYEVTVSAVMT